MEKIKYFDRPTQVMFCDEEGEWLAGIAYCGEIICGCCGGVVEIEEIYEFCPNNVKNPIYIYSQWIDISDEIRGGELPEGLEFDDENCKIIEVFE